MYKNVIHEIWNTCIFLYDRQTYIQIYVYRDKPLTYDMESEPYSTLDANARNDWGHVDKLLKDTL